MKNQIKDIIETAVILTKEKTSSDEVIGTSCSCDTVVSCNEATEAETPRQVTREIIYPFDRYNVTILLSEDGKFCGISSIKESRDFLSNEQFLGKFKNINTDDFYNNEDE